MTVWSRFRMRSEFESEKMETCPMAPPASIPNEAKDAISTTCSVSNMSISRYIFTRRLAYKDVHMEIYTNPRAKLCRFL